MVDRRIRWGKVLAVVAITLAIVHYCHYFSTPNKSMDTPPSTIPEPLPGKEVWVYDLYKNQWIYKDQLPRPAKENPIPSRRNTDKEFQKYLEEHIKGYKRNLRLLSG